MKLREIPYSIGTGWDPVKINGKTYNVYTSERVSFSKDGEQTIYRKKSGEYWLKLMITGVGHFITPLTDDHAKMLILQHESGWE